MNHELSHLSRRMRGMNTKINHRKNMSVILNETECNEDSQSPIIVILILLLSIFNLAFTQYVTLTFDCPDEVVVGSEGNVLSVMMENEIHVDGTQMFIEFDPNIILEG